jgi:hypothetical protein
LAADIDRPKLEYEQLLVLKFFAGSAYLTWNSVFFPQFRTKISERFYFSKFFVIQ